MKRIFGMLRNYLRDEKYVQAREPETPAYYAHHRKQSVPVSTSELTAQMIEESQALSELLRS
jgi:hypothetical protein